MQHILVKSKRKILIDMILGGPETQAMSSLNIVFL